MDSEDSSGRDATRQGHPKGTSHWPLGGSESECSSPSNPARGPLPADAFEDVARSSLKVCRAPVRQRFSINQLTTVRWSLPQAVDEFQSLGVSGIGLSWRKLAETGVARGVRHVQQARLPVSSMGWIAGFTGQHGYSLRETLHEAKRIIRAAGRTQAGCVPVITGPQGPHIRSHARRLVIKGLQELSQLAEIYDVHLALQPMHPLYRSNWSFLNTLDDTLDILEAVDHPRMRMAFGAYHLWDEPALVERIPELVPKVAMVSLADWRANPRHENDRELPGQGCLPLADYVREFEQNGYSGWYELEVWSTDLWEQEHRLFVQQCLQACDSISDACDPMN